MLTDLQNIRIERELEILEYRKEILLHFKNGGDIESCFIQIGMPNIPCWVEDTNPTWNWNERCYRAVQYEYLYLYLNSVDTWTMTNSYYTDKEHFSKEGFENEISSFPEIHKLDYTKRRKAK